MKRYMKSATTLPFFQYMPVEKIEKELDMTDLFDFITGQTTEVHVADMSATVSVSYKDGTTETIETRFDDCPADPNTPTGAWQCLVLSSDEVRDHIASTLESKGVLEE